MQHSITTQESINTPYIDQRIAQLEPYFSDIIDDLPLVDIIITKDRQPAYYRSSIAVFLPEQSFHAHATSRSPDASVRRAFNDLVPKVRRYFDSKAAKLSIPNPAIT